MMHEFRDDNTSGCGTNINDLERYMVLNSTSLKTAIAVLSCTVGTLCILENSLVLYIIFSSAHLRKKASYLFLSSVAVADLLASVVFTYSFVDFHAFKRTGSPEFFLFKLGSVTASFTASLGSLLLTAFDRYICIHRPSEYKAIVTKKRALMALAVMWVVTLIIAYLPSMGLNCCELNSLCSELFPLIDNKYLSFWISLVMVLITLIVYFYIHILWKAHKHVIYMEQHKQQAREAQGQAKMRIDIMLAKTLVLVLTVLLLCWSPVLLLMMYSVLAKLNDYIQRAFAFCSNLCLVNSLVNPCIYALRSRDMRSRLKKGLFWFRGRLRIPGHSQGTDSAAKNSATDTLCEETLADTDAQ